MGGLPTRAAGTQGRGMIPLIITATIVPVAVCAAIILEPHMESWFTRRRLEEAHRAGTSPNVGAETEPHQPRVRTGKSPVSGRKLRA